MDHYLTLCYILISLLLSPSPPSERAGLSVRLSPAPRSGPSTQWLLGKGWRNWMNDPETCSQTSRQGRLEDSLVPATGLQTPVPAWASPPLSRIETKWQLWPGRGVKVQAEIQLMLQRPGIALHACLASHVSNPRPVIGCFSATPSPTVPRTDIAKHASISEKREVVDSPQCWLTPASSCLPANLSHRGPVGREH